MTFEISSEDKDFLPETHHFPETFFKDVSHDRELSKFTEIP